MLDDLGLVMALQDLVSDCRARHPGVDYELIAPVDLDTRDEQITIRMSW